MNHAKKLAIALGLLAATVALIGAVAIDIQQTAAAQTDEEGNTSITNFIFKQKLNNDCSGFANCTNTGTEIFSGLG
jgi:Na+-translocating ferredoxin:NAD+ oxidoreductase RnfG subunit